jgi:DNA-binding transcriptional LysR family regulator
MTQINFRQLDLNLLRVLAAIHRSRSVTAAAKALSLSQPATSNALARLRRSFDDELFVRAPSGLQPTRLCERLAPAVAAQLQTLEATLAGLGDFDPMKSEVRWRLSLSDLGEMLFLTPLAAALRQRAPHAHLANVSVAAEAVPQALEARELDFAIGILQPRHRGIQTEVLFHEHYVAITSARWRPASGRVGKTLTMAQLAAASLVVAAPTATFHGTVEQVLTRMRLAGRIVVRARHFASQPEMVVGTDLLAIVPQTYAQTMLARHELCSWELPRAAAPRYDVRLVWHERTSKDPAHRWMRALVHELFAGAAAKRAAHPTG